MKYYSTRDVERKEGVTSAQAIKQGIACDGGLFMPESIPELSYEEIKGMLEKTYPERAAFVLSKFLTDYTEKELLEIAEKAYSKEKFPDGAVCVSALGENHRVLELWHGPTCAFKDMALQILPHLLTSALEKTKEKKTAYILVATSGDTGKAALEGFRDVKGIKICVFYPENGVSELQKKQMTTQKGENVKVCAITGNFDDAQSGVKEIFSDKKIAKELEEKKVFLSSANSINWGRLVPQIVYYVSAYCDLLKDGDIKDKEEIDICVPTGNFGNIFAAYMAKMMGLPVRKLVCASNKNNVLTDFINTGVYDRNRSFYTTISPSMDILISSNLERLLYVVAGPEKCKEYMESLAKTGEYCVDKKTADKIRETFIAQYCDEDNTRKTIHDVFMKYSYLIDPHTACAFYASQKTDDENKKEGRNIKIVTASTASPYKFAKDVMNSLGYADKEEIFGTIEEMSRVTLTKVPENIANLKEAQVRFTEKTGKTKEEIWASAEKFLEN